MHSSERLQRFLAFEEPEQRCVHQTERTLECNQDLSLGRSAESGPIRALHCWEARARNAKIDSATWRKILAVEEGALDIAALESSVI
eukprot:5395612-Pyramimonas_sp.AAC.2